MIPNSWRWQSVDGLWASPVLLNTSLQFCWSCSSAWNWGGEVKGGSTLLSRSIFRFCPAFRSATGSCFSGSLAIVPLGNSVLNPLTLGQILDLGPVFIWICGFAENTASTLASGTRWRYGSQALVRHFGFVIKPLSWVGYTIKSQRERFGGCLWNKCFGLYSIEGSHPK